MICTVLIAGSMDTPESAQEIIAKQREEIHMLRTRLAAHQGRDESPELGNAESNDGLKATAAAKVSSLEEQKKLRGAIQQALPLIKNQVSKVAVLKKKSSAATEAPNPGSARCTDSLMTLRGTGLPPATKVCMPSNKFLLKKARKLCKAHTKRCANKAPLKRAACRKKALPLIKKQVSTSPCPDGIGPGGVFFASVDGGKCLKWTDPKVFTGDVQCEKTCDDGKNQMGKISSRWWNRFLSGKRLPSTRKQKRRAKENARKMKQRRTRRSFKRRSKRKLRCKDAFCKKKAKSKSWAKVCKYGFCNGCGQCASMLKAAGAKRTNTKRRKGPQRVGEGQLSKRVVRRKRDEREQKKEAKKQLRRNNKAMDASGWLAKKERRCNFKKGTTDEPRVCQKMAIIHVPEMSRSAGVLVMKRVTCIGSKCAVFKVGTCIDVCPECSDPWTEEEDQKLCTQQKDSRGNFIQDAFAWSKDVDKKDWAKVAKRLPGRTAEAVARRVHDLRLMLRKGKQVMPEQMHFITYFFGINPDKMMGQNAWSSTFHSKFQNTKKDSFLSTIGAISDHTCMHRTVNANGVKITSTNPDDKCAPAEHQKGGDGKRKRAWGNLDDQKKLFAERVVDILKSDGTFPKKYRCSDTRHRFAFQKGKLFTSSVLTSVIPTLEQSQQWIHRGNLTHQDATLGDIAIFNF